MIAAPAANAKRAKRPRFGDVDEKEVARIKAALEDMEYDGFHAYNIACALDVSHKAPKSLARELSSTVAISFDYDPAPVFISLAYATKLDDDALCAALAQAALAASALTSVSKLFDVAALTAKLLEPAAVTRSALELALAPPNPNHVILHITTGGIEVDYVHARADDPKFLVPANCHDSLDLAALIVHRAPRE